MKKLKYYRLDLDQEFHAKIKTTAASMGLSMKDFIEDAIQKEIVRIENLDYLEIDFNKVEGYERLSSTAKEVFEQVYKIQNACVGREYKKDYIPIRVKEHKEYIEVHFANGNWLHYLPNGTWY